MGKCTGCHSLLYGRLLCSSRKNPYPPRGRSLEIPRGRGVLEAKILEAKCKAKLEFLFFFFFFFWRGGGGGVVQNKKNLWGEHGFFLESSAHSQSL